MVAETVWISVPAKSMRWREIESIAIRPEDCIECWACVKSMPR